MPVIFQGLRNIGKKQKARSVNDKAEHISAATLEWFAYPNASVDGAATPLLLPNGDPFPISGWKFTLDPTSVQTSFTFGDAKSLLISINRPVGFFTDDTHYLFPGNVFVNVRPSQQFYQFSPKNFLAVVPGDAATRYPRECVNVQVPIEGIEPGIVDVYIEQTINAGIVGISTPQPNKVTFNLGNFDVSPVGQF